jgi:hypothetical protein
MSAREPEAKGQPASGGGVLLVPLVQKGGWQVMRIVVQ